MKEELDRSVSAVSREKTHPRIHTPFPCWWCHLWCLKRKREASGGPLYTLLLQTLPQPYSIYASPQGLTLAQYLSPIPVFIHLKAIISTNGEYIPGLLFGPLWKFQLLNNIPFELLQSVASLTGPKYIFTLTLKFTQTKLSQTKLKAHKEEVFRGT